MTWRRALAVHGMSIETALMWAALVAVGTLAPLVALRVEAVEQMGAEDLTWSVALLSACASWAVVSTALTDRLSAMTRTAARWPLSARAAVWAVVTLASAWPVAWWGLGAPLQVVAPTLTLGLGVVGAAGLVDRWAPRWTSAPAVVVLALTVMPLVLPPSVHPLTPTQRLPSVMMAQALTWLGGSVAYLTPRASLPRLRPGP